MTKPIISDNGQPISAAWFMSANTGNQGFPDIPDGIDSNFVNPLDIYVISGGGHKHTLIGGHAPRSSNLEEVDPETYHTHMVIRLDGGNWFQETVNGVAHTHDLELANDEMQPDFYVFFWYGSYADALAISNDAKCIFFAQAEVTESVETPGTYDFGNLDNEPWTVDEKQFMDDAFDQYFGIGLHEDITSGKRLVQFICGTFLARAGQNERGLRYTSS